MLRNRLRNFGFSLVELLVVISIVAILIALLLPSLRQARHVALDARSASSVRQMLIGYSHYQVDYSGEVLLGKPPDVLEGKPVSVTVDSGHSFGGEIAKRYPWRFANYVQGVWDVIYTHVEPPPEPVPGDDAGDASSKAYWLSLFPTYGLNSVFLGGHDGNDGFVTDSGSTRPNTGQHVVFHSQEVRQPSQLIVFTVVTWSTGALVPDGSGFFQAVAPNLEAPRWEAGPDGKPNVKSYRSGGIPVGRYTNNVITGYFDGHAAGESLTTLDDMRLWANWADDPDYFY